MRQFVQSLCEFSIYSAAFFSFLFVVSFVAHIMVYINRDQFKLETFVVTGAEFHKPASPDEIGDTWWLIGTVAFRQERLVPSLGIEDSPESAEDLLKKYPKGSKISILYNPAATTTLIGSKSMRVIEHTPDVWRIERQRLIRYELLVFVPLPVAVTLYMLVRSVNRRHAELETGKGARNEWHRRMR